MPPSQLASGVLTSILNYHLPFPSPPHLVVTHPAPLPFALAQLGQTNLLHGIFTNSQRKVK